MHNSFFYYCRERISGSVEEIVSDFDFLVNVNTELYGSCGENGYLTLCDDYTDLS